MNTCLDCNTNFEITITDKAFYAKIAMPEPTLCPNCRRQRRFSWRNERYLYKRTCDFSHRSIISTISPDKPFLVYDKDIWWSDQWNGLDYGQDFDFNRPFFDQFAELMKKVPRMNMMLSHCENSDYGPYSVSSRNIYMGASCVESEDIYYSYQTNHSRDSMDCMLGNKNELCYECVYGVNLYNCKWTQNCRDSSDLLFCRDCQSCEKCIGCVNLNQKKLHIFNRPVTEDEYNSFVAQLTTAHAIEWYKKEFLKFSLQFPYRADHNIQTENCIGDRLIKSKNSKYCFEAEELEDCAYIYVLPVGAKDTYDTHYAPKAELVYEAMSGSYDYNCQFVNHSWEVKNSRYVDSCFYSSNLFGCIGLKKNSYCILNKQYTKEEYEQLVLKIVEHMKRTGEFGEFFPMHMSPHAYNESLAQDYFPLTAELAESKGLTWKYPVATDYLPQTTIVPETILAITDTITNEILACEVCTKNYRIITQELLFYRKTNLPIPHKCPNCRYEERLVYRGMQTLLDRTCDKCNRAIKTSYHPYEQKIIYCEACYLNEVY